MSKKGFDSNGDRTSSPTKGSAPRFNQAEFLNYELTEEERKALKAEVFWSEDWDTQLLRLCDAGYKFTIKFDEWSKAYACFLTDGTNATPNAGFILTGRGSTPTKALRQVLFKHSLAPEGVWTNLRYNGQNTIDD